MAFNMGNKWHIQVSLIVSLFLQIILTLFAPFRKKLTNHYIVSLLWLAYLMADWIVTYAIGLISLNQVNSSALAVEVDAALLAFWASFLLLHLGGPDTITAFSLEDSSLWGRHLLSLISQVIAAISIFVQIFLSDKSLVIPTILVFLAAILKNSERTLALNLSSLPSLRESILSKHQYYHIAEKKLIEEIRALQDGYSDEEEPQLPESTVVKHAYFFFQIFKVFLADLMFTQPQRNISRGYFCKVSPVDALRVISVELQFIYEVLNTKVLVIRSKRSYIFRFIAFTSVGVAFILFYHLKKDRLPVLDVQITYSLLYGGMTLDVIALFMLVFSDWTVAEIMHYDIGSSRLHSCLHKLVSATDDLRNPRFAEYGAEPNANVTYDVVETRLIFRRWSESISACNLFSEIFEESPRKMHKLNQCWAIIAFYNICDCLFRKARKIVSCFHRAGRVVAATCCQRNTGAQIPMLANMKYVSKNPFVKKLWVFIFKEVRRKSNDVDLLWVAHVRKSNDADFLSDVSSETSDDADYMIKVKEIIEARGDMFLKSSPGGINCDTLLKYVTVANYDASIIIWHLATEICYSRERRFMRPTARTEEREISKILSDYMLYLLLNQPNVMSTVVGIAKMRSEETLRELLFRKDTERANDVEELCNELIDGFQGQYRTIYLNSALCDGTMLAIEMEKLGEMKWKVMSGVWVEMLSYAAVHIKGEVHVQVLSKGGELLAFVWLLMAHFGCFYKPEWGLFYESWYQQLSEVISFKTSSDPESGTQPDSPGTSDS